MIPQKITKSEIIRRLRVRLPHMPLEDIKMGVNSLLDSMQQALRNKRNICLRGFGTFYLSHFAEREICDFQPGIKKVIPAYDVPRFRAGKILKKKLSHDI